jgi:hypothetical protein
MMLNEGLTIIRAGLAQHSRQFGLKFYVSGPECELAHTPGRESDAPLSGCMRGLGGGFSASSFAERQEAVMNIQDNSNVARLQAIYAKLARIAAQMNDPRPAQKRNSNPDDGVSVCGKNTRSNLVRLVDVIAQRRDARM